MTQEKFKLENGTEFFILKLDEGNNCLNKWNRSIFVPDSSVDAYKTTSGWSNYASRIHPINEYTK